MKNFLSFASVSYALLLTGCVGDTADALDDTSDDSQSAIGTPMTIPGGSANFKVLQTSRHSFVLHGYANAVLVDVGNGAVALIDTLAPAHISPTDLPDIRATLSYLSSLGMISGTTIRYIVNTHWHPDHVGNNDALRTTSTEVIAARGGTQRVSTPQTIKYFGAELPAWPAATWPSREVATGESLFSVGGSIDVSYLPYSHTTTDLLVRLPKEKVVVAGDLIIGGAYAFTDHDNGGSMRGLLLSLDQVLAQTPDDHLIVPGHYGVMTKGEARAWGDAIRAGVRFVDGKMAAGVPLAEIQAAAATEAPAEFRALDGSVITQAAFVEFTYRDLAERDLKALVASRVLARLKSVTRTAMIAAITASTLGGEDAAGKEYDTLAFEIGELESVGGVVTADAQAAMDIYDRYVAVARQAGRTDLTAAEYQTMLLELAGR
jgi:cyclase